MNPGRYFMPGTGPMMRATSYMSPSRGMGLFGRIGNSLRSFNWSGLLNGANKTLNVVNQTIPLVRQAGPMFNNMKSMFRLAKAFGNETTSRRVTNNRSVNMNSNFNTQRNINNDINNSKLNVDNNKNDNGNYPNFFI